MEPAHHEGGRVLPVFLCPTDPYPVSLVFSSSALYATTALLSRSLKRQLWLCCPFRDVVFWVFFFFWESPRPVPASSPEGGQGSPSHQASPQSNQALGPAEDRAPEKWNVS